MITCIHAVQYHPAVMERQLSACWRSAVSKIKGGERKGETPHLIGLLGVGLGVRI